MSEYDSSDIINEAEEFNLAGNCAVKEKEYDKAIRFYNYAINKCPQEARYLANRSAAFLGNGDRSRALQDAERVIEMKPTWYKGYSRKASVLLHVKKFKDCIEACKTALSLEGKDEAALQILSIADKTISTQRADDFSALEAAEANYSDDNEVEESNSRLKKLREQKRLESFLLTIDDGLKPIIDTEKDRNVTDEAIYEMTIEKHIERLTGKNAYWKNLNPFRVLLLPEEASDEDIRQRYLKLSNLIHPDKCSLKHSREAFEAVKDANELLKDSKQREECISLIKGATKSVIKNHERLLSKGINPSTLPTEEVAIKEEIMRVFAQNEQRKRKAKQYFNLYSRREKEQQEQKRQKIVEEIKDHHEFLDGTDNRVKGWQQYLKKNKDKKKTVTFDDMSGQTDHDKRRKVEQDAYYTALGEEYKKDWR